MENCNELPRIDVFRYYNPDEPDSSGGEIVEFRLIYQGSLPSENCEKDEHGRKTGRSGRAKDKHRIRKEFHLQLRELWKMHPDLRAQSEQAFVVVQTPGPVGGLEMRQMAITPQVRQEWPDAKTWLERIADSHIRCNGDRFVPLISKAGGFTCALDILFLRRDNPGGLVDNHGDIDNRIKVLFDSLKMPLDVKELGGYLIDPDENPFFCLMEDDSLITRVNVTTDRLIMPQKTEENISDVMLVIHVTMVNPSAVFAGGRLV